MFKTKLCTAKISVSFGIMLASSTCFAGMPANYYECKSSTKNITVYYLPFGDVVSKPTLFFSVDKRTYEAVGDEIQLQKTVLGNLISMVKTSVPDLYTDTMTLLLPDVYVTDFGNQTNFKTKFLITHASDSIGGPQFISGVIQTNRVTTLNCSATTVAF
jgi:hypothetical protein